jgi:hypothetical protein
MADTKTQEGTAAVAEAEDRSPEAAVEAGGELDREAQTEHKPRLSDEERLQGLEPDKLRQMMYDMLLARKRSPRRTRWARSAASATCTLARRPSPWAPFTRRRPTTT